MHDPAAGDEQQDRFRQRGKVFDLAVAIGMGFIRGAGRDADGEEGDARGYKVKAAVQGFGKDTEAVGGEPRSELDERQEQRPERKTKGPRVVFRNALRGARFR